MLLESEIEMNETYFIQINFYYKQCEDKRESVFHEFEH